MSEMDYYGEFAAIAPLLITLGRLRECGFGRDFTLILPADVLPGATRAYDLPVVRADVDAPMIGVRG